MVITKYRSCLVHFILLLVAACGVSAAGERCDIYYENELDEEIVDIRVKFSTPYDEPRHSSARVNLPPGGSFRIGVQGTTLPEVIIVDLALKSLVFDDLSGIDPANDMRLAIVMEDGSPRLRRTDAVGEAVGVENEYLTAVNRPNAVDKDRVMALETADELGTVIVRTRSGRPGKAWANWSGSTSKPVPSGTTGTLWNAARRSRVNGAGRTAGRRAGPVTGEPPSRMK